MYVQFFCLREQTMCALFCVRSKSDELFELWDRFRCDEKDHSIKKKTIKSMKKIIKTVSLIFETFFFASLVAATEFLNSVMFDALKRFDFSFVDFSKRQILSTFVVFSFLSFHRNDSTSLIAFLFFELIRINRNFARFKEKMYSNVFAFAKKIIKIAKNVIQLSIVFNDLRKAMKMLKNRLLTMKKLMKSERMLIFFSKIDSKKKAFVSFAEIADERIITIENNHENQKNKFIVREKSIILIN